MRSRTRRTGRLSSSPRSAFAQINASWSIEGQAMDAADLALQSRVIAGELTTEQAIEIVKRRYQLDSTSNDDL